MPLTPNQIKNLHKLAIPDIYEIAQECDEILGRVTIAEYSKITGVPLRTKHKAVLSERNKRYYQKRKETLKNICVS